MDTKNEELDMVAFIETVILQAMKRRTLSPIYVERIGLHYNILKEDKDSGNVTYTKEFNSKRKGQFLPIPEKELDDFTKRGELIQKPEKDNNYGNRTGITRNIRRGV